MQPGLGASLVWFLVVVALIPVALWLLKRTPLAGAGGSRPGLPRTVAVLPLSAHHKLITVEVGQGAERRWLVLGVGPQGMNTVHQMAPQDDAGGTSATPPGAAFAQVLGRLRGGRKP